MSNTFKRGKIFWGRIQIEGKTYRTSLRTRNAQEALSRFRKWEQELKSEIYDGTVSASWEQAAGEFISQASALVPNDSTRERYMVSLRQVGEHLEGLKIADINSVALGRMIAARRLDEVTNATLKRDLTAISWVFRIAMANNWCQNNPARSYDRKLVREFRELIRIPEDAEVEAAAGALPLMMGEAVRFAQLVGMRENEILTLEYSDIRFAVDEAGRPYNGAGRDRILQINLHKTKTNRKRVIRLQGPLLSEAVAVLDRLPRHVKSPFVFWHGKNGEAYRNFSSNFVQQRKSHGIGFRFHDLRHKFAVRYLQRGGNLYDLQRILGHSSVKTTEMYLEHLDTTEEFKTAVHGPGFGFV